MCISALVTTLSVFRSLQQEFSTLIRVSSCPVIAAFSGMCPGCHFLFICLGRVFICCRNTYIIRFCCLWIPETGINISIFIRNLAVRLSTERIFINPQRFHCLCIECLDCSLAESDKNHSVRISRWLDCKGRRSCKRTSAFHQFSGYRIHFQQILTVICVQISVYKNRMSAVTVKIIFICPVENAVFCFDRCLLI